MLPVMRRIAGDTYVFQQDSAPAHRARDIVQLLQQQTPEFIAPDLWPPNSPDLNPVDYCVWGLMQERVYRTAVRDTADLKRRLTDTWSYIPQTIIDETIYEWELRLRACVKANERHFEHSLLLTCSFQSHQMLPHNNRLFSTHMI